MIKMAALLELYTALQQCRPLFDESRNIRHKPRICYMTENVEKLLTDVSKILRNRSEEQKKTFNAFDMAKIGSEETRHSAIIAALLDPKGPLGKGPEPLKAFFRQIGLYNLAKLCDEETEVKTEYSIPGRRMDIVISSKTEKKFCIVIENKTATTDHELQLKDYRKWLDDNQKAYQYKVLLYLTYEGDDAKNFQGEYEIISYRTHICNWLRECALMHQENTAKSVFCSQYCDFIINILLEGKREMDENLRTVIVDNFEAAVEISKSIDETKAFLLHENLTERFEKEGFSVSEKTNSDIITGRGLDYNVTFSDLSKRYEIELGFDHYYFWGSRTLIRFLDLNVDKDNLEKITHEYQESGWRIEKSQGLLVLGNHHNKITLDDSFFYALANNDLEKRDDAIRDILRQYVNQKNEAVTMANSILDLLKGNGPLTKNAEGV